MKRRVYLLWCAGALLMAAGIWAQALPHWSVQPLGLSPNLGLALLAIGGLRMLAALRAGRITAAVRRSVPLRLAAKRLPRAPGQTYLGHGFEWTVRHTARLHELLKDDAHAHPRDPQRHLGVSPLIHGVGGDSADRPLLVPDRLLAQHTLILGTTGVGKTRLFELLIMQAIRRGEAVIVIDPKGDEALLDRVVTECRRLDKQDDFLLFAPPYPTQSVSYDPLKNWVRVGEIPDRIAPLIPGGGGSEPFRKFAWSAINIIAHALAACSERVTLAKIRSYCLDDMWQLVRLFLEKNYPARFDSADLVRPSAIEDAAERWLDLAQTGGVEDSEELRRLIALAKRPRDNYQKMTNSLIPVLDSLSTGPMRDLLSPTSSDLDWQRLAAHNQVAYLFLGSMLGYETANAIAKMALMDFQSYAGATYAYRTARHYVPINLFVDELSNVINPEFVNLLNKARGAGIRVTMAAQTGSDLEAALGSRAMAEQVVGNANIVIQLRAQSFRDAKLFSELAGRRSIALIRETATVRPAFGLTGKRDVADFDASYGVQRQEQEVDMVPPAAITELPTGQFFGRWQGRVYKGRIPLVEESGGNYLVDLGVKR